MDTGAKKKILIADDNPRLLKLLELRFSQSGYAVCTAEKIKDAVVTAIITQPDIIITDVMMSEINGWEFKKLLVKIPNMADIPFIFLTSTETLPDEFYAQDFGTTDYMQKPYAFDDLLAKVEKNLRRHEERQKTLSTQGPTQSGILNDMSLTDILQVLSMNKRDSTVKLVSGSKSGEIYFKQGRIYGAQTGSLKGDCAVYELLSWERVNFWIGEDTESAEESISKDLHSLMVEGIKYCEGKKSNPPKNTDSSDLEEFTQHAIQNEAREEIIKFLSQLQDKGLLREHRK